MKNNFKKKHTFEILLFVIVVFLSFSVQVLAEENIKVTINGNPVIFEDTVPIIKNDRTLVPMRAIFEAMGAKVTWIEDMFDGQKITATKDDMTVLLKLNSSEAVVNGKKIQMEVPAMDINSRVMVPVRFIAESFGCKVEWDQSLQTVMIQDE